MTCTCLSISRDPFCPFHGDVDKVRDDAKITFALKALKNSGVDIECGACMEVAFTGVTTNAHTCARRNERLR